MTAGELLTIRMTVDNILDAAPKEAIGGPVNWGDLYCFTAREWHDCDGDTGVTVIIEEAGDSAVELHTYVREELAKRGVMNVEVVTQW